MSNSAVKNLEHILFYDVERNELKKLFIDISITYNGLIKELQRFFKLPSPSPSPKPEESNGSMLMFSCQTDIFTTASFHPLIVSNHESKFIEKVPGDIFEEEPIQIRCLTWFMPNVDLVKMYHNVHDLKISKLLRV